MPKAKPFVYGQSPNPTTWHEAADALKAGKPTAKKPGAPRGHA